VILDRMQAGFDRIPGIFTEYQIMTGGPAGQKPLHLRLTGEDFDTLGRPSTVRPDARDPRRHRHRGYAPLPGIDWEIRVDVGRAGRFGADVATVGGMVQLVTRGLMLDTMRVDTSDEEIEIRVRLPEGDRLLATLDTLRVQTRAGMVPLSNFVTREAVPLRPRSTASTSGAIRRQGRGGGQPGQRHRCRRGETLRVCAATRSTRARIPKARPRPNAPPRLRATRSAAGERIVPINANERIETLTEWLQTEAPLPEGIGWEWTGEQQDQQESQAS
jgi:multidrug efflux pump